MSNPVEPSRLLKREWKRYKHHLPRSDSLPALQFIPQGRPIFTCGQCGFTNTRIDICLWCSWKSEAATRDFERSMPRRPRRASAPSRVFWSATDLHQHHAKSSSSCLTSVESRERITRMSRSALLSIGSVNRDTGRGPTTQLNSGLDLPTCALPSVTVAIVDDKSNPDYPALLRNWKHEWPPAVTHSSSTATNVTTVTSRRSQMFGKFHKRRDQADLTSPTANTPKLNRKATHHPRAIVSTDIRVSSDTLYSGVDRSKPDFMITASRHDVLKFIPTKPCHTPSSKIPPDDDTHHEFHDNEKTIYDLSPPPYPQESILPHPSAQQRTLRRKNHLSILRAPIDAVPIAIALPKHSRNHSTPHARAAYSLPSYLPLSPAIETPPSVPSTPNNISPSTPLEREVRLGHPSRPYYTAIRKNMSRPTSLTSQISHHIRPQSYPPTTFASSEPSTEILLPPRAMSPDFFSPFSPHPSHLPVLDPDESDFSSWLSPYPSTSPSQAFNLGRSFGRGHRTGYSMSGETELRMALSGGTAGEYRFREVAKDRTTVLGRVKRMSKGLKEMLVLRK